MAQDHHAVVSRLVLFGGEGAAQGGREAEDGEEVAADSRPEHPLRGVALGQVELAIVHGGQGGERTLPLVQVEEVAGGGGPRHPVAHA